MSERGGWDPDPAKLAEAAEHRRLEIRGELRPTVADMDLAAELYRADMKAKPGAASKAQFDALAILFMGRRRHILNLVRLSLGMEPIAAVDVPERYPL